MNCRKFLIPILFIAIGGSELPACDISLNNPRACAPVAAWRTVLSDLGKLSLDCNLDSDGSAVFRDLCRLMQRDDRVACRCGIFSLEEVNSHLYWGGIAIVAVSVPNSRIGHAGCHATRVTI